MAFSVKTKKNVDDLIQILGKMGTTAVHIREGLVLRCIFFFKFFKIL